MKSQDRIAANDFPRDWRYYTLNFPTARYKYFSWAEILDEMNACGRSFYLWRRILWRVVGSFLSRRHPILSLVSNLSFRNNARLSRSSYGQLSIPDGGVRGVASRVVRRPRTKQCRVRPCPMAWSNEALVP